MKTEFPSLPEAQLADGAALPRICIATWEIEGPSQECRHRHRLHEFGRRLSCRANYDVTVLFLLGYHPTDGNMNEDPTLPGQQGHKAGAALMPHTPTIHANWAAGVSYHTYVC